MNRGPSPPPGPGERPQIYIEFIVRGAYVKVTAIDSVSGQEASIVGPATAPREALAQAARRKLDYVRKQKGGA